MSLLFLLFACDVRVYTLTRVEPEFAGDNCAEGGIVLHEGVDGNRDGELSDDEIDRSSYLCNGETPVGLEGIHQGDVVVKELGDLAVLDGIDTITGDLVFTGVGLDDVVVPGIRAIGGRVVAGDLRDGTLLQRIELPDLAWAGGGVELDNNPRLTALVAPNLSWASDGVGIRLSDNPLLSDISGLTGYTAVGAVEIWGDNRALDVSDFAFGTAVGVEIDGRVAGDVVLPELTAVDGTLLVQPLGDSTTRVALPALTSAGGLVVGRSPHLADISAPLLQGTTGDLLVIDLAGLDSLELPLVATVGGNFEVLEVQMGAPLEMPALGHVVGRTKVQDNGITEVAFPQLLELTGPIWIGRNSDLVQVDMGAVSKIGNWKTLPYAVENNPRLERVVHSGDPLVVDGMFVVKGNPLLEDLSGFQSITQISGMFQVENNGLIEPCDIQALIDTIGVDNIGGDLVVDGGCD